VSTTPPPAAPKPSRREKYPGARTAGILLISSAVVMRLLLAVVRKVGTLDRADDYGCLFFCAVVLVAGVILVVASLL
jgi:hypothetical protein